MAVKVNIEVDEVILKELVFNYLSQELGLQGMELTKEDVSIKVKSKQNYRSEWEEAEFKAEVTKISHWRKK